MLNILHINAKMIAKRKLLRGPAREVIIISRLGWRKLKGSMGTGLAQPIVGIPVKALNKGRRMVPIGSAWANGFKVKRPNDLGVGSPSLSAIKP